MNRDIKQIIKRYLLPDIQDIINRKDCLNELKQNTYWINYHITYSINMKYKRYNNIWTLVR